MYLHDCIEVVCLFQSDNGKTFFFNWSQQGFPGDMGPPGENGLEGPKVSKTVILAESSIMSKSLQSCEVFLRFSKCLHANMLTMTLADILNTVYTILVLCVSAQTFAN